MDVDKVHDQLEQYFSNYPRKGLPPVYIPQEPPQLGGRRNDTKFRTELTRLNLAWHIPSVTSPDVPALDLLSTILGDGASSRLNQRLREKLGLVNAIGAYCYTPGDPGLFGIDANLDPANRRGGGESHRRGHRARQGAAESRRARLIRRNAAPLAPISAR